MTPPCQKDEFIFVNPSLNKDSFLFGPTVSISMSNENSPTDFTVTKVMSWKVKNCVCLAHTSYCPDIKNKMPLKLTGHKK